MASHHYRSCDVCNTREVAGKLIVRGWTVEIGESAFTAMPRLRRLDVCADCEPRTTLEQAAIQADRLAR